MSKGIITILRLENQIIAPFTNNLAAFEKIKGLISKEEICKLPGYSTINRIVSNPGDSKSIQTNIGLFNISKYKVLKKGT
ncbi:MAG: hypothetical protein V4547_16215 [Bacteroidota bacterium]